MDPLISVIIPIYNSEVYLKRCVDSVRNQSYKNLEIILINDGSTDSSINICKDLQKNDDRIQIIDKNNQGVSAARNDGLRKSKGEYIAFVDSDDYIEKSMYENMINYMNNDIEVVTLANYTINENSEVNKELDSEKAIKKLFTMSFPTSVWPYLYNKNILKEITFNENITFFEDFLFNFYVLKKAKKIFQIRENLYNYTRDENTNSINQQKFNDKRLGCLLIYPKIYKEIKNEKELVEIAQYFRSYFLFSMFTAYSKSGIDNPRWNKYIQSEANEMIKEVIASKYVPFKYKIGTVLSSFNFKWNARIYRLLKK